MDAVRSLVKPAAWDRQLQAIHSALESLSSGAFYRHGLFCASHPYVTLFFSFVLLFFLSSPIVHQLHTNLVQTEQTTKPVLFWETTSPHTSIYRDRIHEKYGTVPFLRLEQIVINVTQAPTSDGLAAVRGAVDRKFLEYAMDLQQKISASVAEFGEDADGRPAVGSATRRYTLSDICYKPHGSDRCLVHSPLEYWASDSGRFKTDGDYLRTLSNASVLSSLGIPIPLPSVFGGVRLDGMTGSIVGAESLLITYFLIERNTENNYGETISDVWDKLWDGVTLPADVSGTVGLPAPVAWRADGEPKLLYYEFGRSSSLFTGESLVLGVMYLIVFLYISLVLGKVDLVKSKFALGFGAVVTVFSGLIMSVGLCSMLGVKTSLVPWEALPFLIIVVGVENISVLTNAVVKTSLDLPVKERVGLGLSKVGASMTLSLGGEMLLLLIASTTSIPALQEFCLFAAVSIVMDYFMQITFFITILSIDIRRLELSDLHKLRQAQSVTSAPRLSSATAYTPPGESPPEILEAAPRRRPHWASYLIIMVIVLLLGFGLSGSSSPMAGREKDISAATSSQENRRVPLISALSAASCENSMCSTADAFWHVIDPDRSAKYVEIRPSTFIMFDMADVGPKQGNFSATEKATALQNDFAKGGWRLSSLREPSRTRRFMTDAHPAIFMVTIVSLLLACVLLLVMLSGLTVVCMRMRRPFRRKYSMEGTAQDTCPRMSFDRTWERSGSGAVLTIPSGDYEEMDAVTMAGDSVAWISSKTRAGYAFGRDECRRRSIPRRRRGRRRGRIEVIATQATGSETIMAIGTESGWVEIWNLDSRSLLVEDSGPTCAAVTRLLFGTVDGSLSCFVGRADGGVSVMLAFPREGGMDKNGRAITLAHRHSGAIRDMYLNQRGFLYTASDDMTACCWAASRNAHGIIEWALSCLLSAHSARLTALACDPTADLLATGDADGDIFVWSTRTGKPLVQILNGRRRRRRRKGSDASERTGHRGAVTALRFAPAPGLGARNVLRRVLCSAGADELVNVWEFSLGFMQDNEISSSAIAAVNRNRSSSAPTPAPRSFSSGSTGRRDSRGSEVSNESSNGRPFRPSSNGGPHDPDDDPALVGSSSGAVVVNLKHLGNIRQPGCTAIAVYGSLLAGVRTLPIPKPGTDSLWTVWSRRFGWERSTLSPPSRSGDPPPQSSPTLRAERGQDWAWQVWMTDVSAWEAGPQPMRSVVIGRDHLRGLGSRRAEDNDEVSDEGGGSGSGSSSSRRRKSSSGSSSTASAAATNHAAFGGIGGVRRRPRMADDSSSASAGAAGDEPGVRVATARRPSMGIRAQPLDDPPQMESTGRRRVSASSSGSDGPSTASTFNETSDSASNSASGEGDDDDDESDESDYGPSAASRQPENNSDDDDERQQLPVLQVRSIAVSDAGVAVAFGTTVKLLLFGGEIGSEIGANGGSRQMGDGWVSFQDRDHGGAPSGKVHLA